MNNLRCLILMFFRCRTCSCQNLLIDGSFKDTITCSLSTFPYAVECAPPWYTASVTPDYGSSTYSCASIIPPNNALAFGYQYPRTGNSHIGCGIWLYPLFLPNRREYFGAELI